MHLHGPCPCAFALANDNGAMVLVQHKKHATQFEAMEGILMNALMDGALTQECVNGMLWHCEATQLGSRSGGSSSPCAIKVCSAGFDVDDLHHALQNANCTSNFIGIMECATSLHQLVHGEEAQLVFKGIDKEV